MKNEDEEDEVRKEMLICFVGRWALDSATICFGGALSCIALDGAPSCIGGEGWSGGGCIPEGIQGIGGHFFNSPLVSMQCWKHTACAITIDEIKMCLEFDENVI